ncbi:hypothetical protein V2S84_18565, partial [Azotobacter chroococcum]|nr:hypothetical protein [Azotobacter chroococcum]
STGELNDSMKLMDFQHGAYTRKAIYKQFYSKNEAVLYGKTIVQFDINWNVVGISRMIVTPQKFPLDKLKAGIPGDKAIKIASDAKEDCASDDAKPLLVEPSIDLIRKRRVWNVELTSKRGACHWRVIVDRAEGTVLNVSDLVSQAYNDAKVNRWYFSGGDLFSPQQIASPNQYTRNDRRLEHDFFYMMNDHRCEGSAETDCATPHKLATPGVKTPMGPITDLPISVPPEDSTGTLPPIIRMANRKLSAKPMPITGDAGSASG